MSETSGPEPNTPKTPETSEANKPLSRPPTAFEIVVDRTFGWFAWGLAWASVVLVLYIVFVIGSDAVPAIQAQGLDMFTTSDWKPVESKFGVWPHIFGTLYSSLLALLIAMVLGVAVAIFLTEDFLPGPLQVLLKNIVELLAAIPSVIYGLWGIYIVIPTLRGPAEWLHENAGWFPLFSTNFNGPGMLPAVLVLSIMVLPTITALSRDAIANVPPRLKEGAIGLGATRWEAILKIVVPTASTGIFGAAILALGRALGETMALAMLVGNRNIASWSLFSPGNTLAALLANNFSEAVTDPPQISALMFAALILMGITLLVNVLGSLIIARAANKLKGLR